MNGPTSAKLQYDGMQEVSQLLDLGQSFLEHQKSYMIDNLQLFETIKSNYLEVNRLRSLLQEQIKLDLQALLNENQRMDEQNDGKREIIEMAKQEQQLQQELEVVQQNQQQLSSHCEGLMKDKENLRGEKDRLACDKERLENETTEQLPKRREEIKLLTEISRIRWDFDGAEHEVKGYISNKMEVKPFNFDQRKCSQFFITNSLWDSMKED